MTHINKLIDFAVTGFIVYQGKVLLVLHKKLNLWLPPGGHIELDEDPEEALIREVKEECGLDVEIYGQKPEHMSKHTKILHVPIYMDIHKINEAHRHIGMHYFCTCKSGNTEINQNELNDLKWFSKDDLTISEDIIPEIKFYALQALEQINT